MILNKDTGPVSLSILSVIIIYGKCVVITNYSSVHLSRFYVTIVEDNHLILL